VPVAGADADVPRLAGSWRGEYWSGDTGRSGLIRFELDAADGGARGDVLMLPAGHREEGRAALEQTPLGAGRLAIRFVTVDAATETVSGTLEPYRDPQCDCVVSTTFVGRVSRDRIEGTFVTQGGEGRPARLGNWRVTRTRGDASS
jgi:hypothetical protein